MNDAVNPTVSLSTEIFPCKPQARFLENRRRVHGYCLPNNHPRRLGFLTLFPGEEALEEFEKRFRKNYSTIFFAGSSRGIPRGYRKSGLVFMKDLSTTPQYTYTGARIIARAGPEKLGDAFVYMMAGDAFLERVKVDPGAQRQGIASSLVEKVEGVAKEFGSRRLLINSPDEFPIVRSWCEQQELEAYAFMYRRR